MLKEETKIVLYIIIFKLTINPPLTSTPISIPKLAYRCGKAHFIYCAIPRTLLLDMPQVRTRLLADEATQNCSNRSLRF